MRSPEYVWGLGIADSGPRAALALGRAPLVVSGMQAPGALAAQEEVIYVVPGLPDELVDVSVDGETVATDVATAGIVGPFTVSRASNEGRLTDAEGKVVAENMVTTRPDSNSDVVVHLPTTAGDRIVTVFDNDMTAVPTT